MSLCFESVFYVPAMTFSIMKQLFLALSLISISVLSGNFGMADEDLPQTQTQTQTQTGATIEDPAQIVAKALICFNDKYIYNSCEESCRLTESGNLDVPPQSTDQYCNGPCLEETHLVLTCIENIFTNFEFYNRATIQDVRETVNAGCGSGGQRGNFNVAEHIQAAQSNKADKIAMPVPVIVVGLVGMTLVSGLLL